MTYAANMASKMRHRITIQTQSLTPDGGGGAELTWLDHMTIWAAIDTFSEQSSRNLQAESFRAGQIQSRSIFRFTMRYIDSIDTTMRISHENKHFNIRNVINIAMKNEFLEIFAEQGVSQ